MHSFTCNLSNTCTCKLSNTYTFKMTNACTCKLLRITLSLHIYGWHITYGCMHACFLTTIIIRIVMQPYLQTILLNGSHCCNLSLFSGCRTLTQAHAHGIYSFFFKITSYGYQLQQ